MLKIVFKPRLTLNIPVSIALIILAAIVVTFATFVAQPQGMGEIFSNFRETNYLNFLLNLLPAIFLMLLLFFVSGSTMLSIGSVSFVFLALSLANRIKILMRNDPIFPWELSMGAEVITILRTSAVSLVVLGVIFVLLSAFCIVASALIIRTNKINLYIRIACVLVTAAVIFIGNATIYHNAELINSLHVNGNRWNQTDAFVSRGFVYSFIFAHNTQRITMPADFDRGRLDDARDAMVVSLPEIDGITRPHIIMIMGEAFSEMGLHPQVCFEGFGYHPQYYWQQLIQHENTIYGQLIVPHWGGGTGDTEFDVLTGLNTRALRGAPFSYRLVNNYFDAMPHMLNRLGYRSIAMHPGFAWFYNRQNVYRFFGFEHFYCMSYFDWQTQNKGGYISEEATMDKLLAIWHRHLTEHPGMPLFNFTVTIQNHGPYHGMYGVDTNFSTTLELDENEMDQVSNYFHGLRDADVQLQRLIEYFEYSDEPVVLVYFSDHLPGLSAGINAQFFPDIYEHGSFDSFARLHTVPFIIWQNSAAKEITPIAINYEAAWMPRDMTIGANFLGAYLLELLGFDGVSALMDYVNILRTQFPVVLEEMAVRYCGTYSFYVADELLIYRDWQFDLVFN